ncbi:hypothetical protein REPUB_Repub08aG0122200 [Reevesia pubescens]
MANDLEDLWSKLSLTEEEQTEVCLNVAGDDDSVLEYPKWLFCKAITRKRINMASMKNVLTVVWKLSGSLSIKEIGDKIYIFRFEIEDEKNKVFFSQSWFFNKSLLVFKEADPHVAPESINFHFCPFWIQIQGLPVGSMTEATGMLLGKLLGVVEEVDTGSKLLRIRAQIDINKTLLRCSKVSFSEGKKMLVWYRYERLQDFCYICGKLDHQETECLTAYCLKKDVGMIRREFGP